MSRIPQIRWMLVIGASLSLLLSTAYAQQGGKKNTPFTAKSKKSIPPARRSRSTARKSTVGWAP